MVDLLNMEDPHEKQMKDLQAWLDSKLTKHMESRKSFKVGEDSTLSEEDFVKIYKLIESFVNAQTYTET